MADEAKNKMYDTEILNLLYSLQMKGYPNLSIVSIEVGAMYRALSRSGAISPEEYYKSLKELIADFEGSAIGQSILIPRSNGK